MAYFVTGATGFIGRRLVELLLDKRQGKVFVLVREGSLERLEDLIERWRVAIGASAAKRVEPVSGDLRRPLLGVEQERVTELRGKIVHFFHLAAIYDMTAPSELNTAVNVGGTTHAVELARALEAEHLHHVSSIAVAGEFKGLFEEDMFDEGQKLPSPYHRTKFESERIVRRTCPGGCTGRQSSWGTRRRARWTRSTARTTSSRRSSACVSCCRSGRRLWGWTSATRTLCRWTGWWTRWSTSRTSRTSTAKPSISPTRAASAWTT
jgi:uncharacterized protein YbjT (DUF2867 family)